MWHVWETVEVHTGSRWGDLKGREHLDDPGVDVRIILKRMFRKLDVGYGLFGLTHDSDRWRAFVNAVMNLRVP